MLHESTPMNGTLNHTNAGQVGTNDCREARPVFQLDGRRRTMQLGNIMPCFHPSRAHTSCVRCTVDSTVDSRRRAGCLTVCTRCCSVAQHFVRHAFDNSTAQRVSYGTATHVPTHAWACCRHGCLVVLCRPALRGPTRLHVSSLASQTCSTTTPHLHRPPQGSTSTNISVTIRWHRWS